MSDHALRGLEKRNAGSSEYESYLRKMEVMRLNYYRCQRGGNLVNPDTGKLVRNENGRIKTVRERPGPMPLDLKVYDVARKYDGDKRKFSKTIAELVKLKAEIHPFMRRFLLERLRDSEIRHRELANRFGAFAEQFEMKEQPQSVSRDVAILGSH